VAAVDVPPAPDVVPLKEDVEETPAAEAPAPEPKPAPAVEEDPFAGIEPAPASRDDLPADETLLDMGKMVKPRPAPPVDSEPAAVDESPPARLPHEDAPFAGRLKSPIPEEEESETPAPLPKETGKAESPKKKGLFGRLFGKK
jgi:hypothetical protein